MKPPILRLLFACLAILTVLGIENVVVAQLPPELDARYKVERVTIPRPDFYSMSVVHQIRVNFSEPLNPLNPYAIVIGSFKSTDVEWTPGFGPIGFIYDHFGTIVEGQTKHFYALDELPGTQTYPPAWAGPEFVSSSCRSCNSSGLVTGYLSDPATNEHLAFYLDITDPNLEIKEIPRPGGREPTDHWFIGQDVNQSGEILVSYIDNVDGRSNHFLFDSTMGVTNPNPIPFRFIDTPAFNSCGDLVGRAFDGSAWIYNDPDSIFIKRYNYVTPFTDYVPNDSLSHVAVANDVGQFMGTRRVTDRRGRNKGENGDYITRYGSNFEVEFDSRARRVYSLNLFGDFSFDRSSTGSDPLPNEVFVFQDEWDEMTLLDLVPDADPQNPNDPSDVLANCQFLNDVRLSDRDSTGLGWMAISGMAAGAELEQELFLLIPYVPGQTPGISVSPTSGLVTTEAGGTDFFDVVLDTEPTASVTIDISSFNTDEGLLEDPDNLGGPLLESYTLEFDASNWDQPQTVTVVGVDDDPAIADGDIEYTIVADATGGDYEGLTAEVTVTNLDNEVSNVTMSVDDPSVIEGDRKVKTRGEFTITLSESSASEVQVWYQVSNGSAGNKDYRMVDSASGWLTIAAWDTSETVSFDVLGDTRRESDETFTIELTDAVGATISKSVGTATIIDND